MNKVIIAAYAVLFIFMGSQHVVKQEPPPQKYVTVAVYAPSNGGDTGRGSGVLVARDRVLTNNHVVRGGKSFMVEIEGNKLEAELLRVDKVNDLALLKIKPVLYAPVKAGARVSKGDRVRICGFKGLQGYREVSGNVVGWRSPTRDSEDSIFLVGAKTFSGMSGGPVFNQNNELVGIMFGCLDYVNCVSIEKIQEFLNK